MHALLPSEKTPSLGLQNSRWVTANAGSGKTYTLTWRIVQCLLHGAAPESIWCVTYTNAAANEMRERLVKLLKELSYIDDITLAEKLSPWVDMPALYADKVRMLYSSLLDSAHGGVRFMTMHGLCQSLLASFPLEAGIVPGFSLIEDDAQKQRMLHAIERVLGDSTTLDPTGAVENALRIVLAAGNYGRVQDILMKLAQQKHRWAWLAEIPFAEIARKYREMFEIPESHTIASLQHDFLSQPPIDCSLAIQAFATNNTPKLQGYADVLLRWQQGDSAARFTLLNDYQDVFLTKQGTARKLHHSWFGSKILAHDGEAVAFLLREQARVEAYVEEYTKLKCLEEASAMTILASAALQIYRTQNMRDALLDYDDLLSRCHYLTTQADMMPWVMSKLDFKLEHLLIDEAQDTSPMQWQILQTFIEEIIAQKTNALTPKTMFVVGDEKQSIYSFQGAAPWLLDEMKTHFSAYLQHSDAPLEEKTLATSYRSAPAVLDFVNALCRHPELLNAFSANPVPEHLVYHSELPGMVELWPLVEQPEVTEIAPYTVPTSYVVLEAATHTLAQNVATAIRDLIDAPNVVKDRRLRAGDILILVRNRNPMTPLIIQALEAANVPVLGADRLALGEHIAVKDLMALIRWCYAPHDDVALAQILRSPLIGISEDALFTLAYNRGEASLWQRVQASVHGETLMRWRNKRYENAYGFLHYILEIEQLSRSFTARMGEEVLEILDELLLFSANKNDTPEAELLAFSHMLTQRSPIIKRDGSSGDTDKVQVMTVHSAKGLEAPVVFLVDTTAVPDLRKEPIFYHETGAPLFHLSEDAEGASVLLPLKEAKKQQLRHEYFRLLYVAVTRSAERLYITGAAPKKKSAEASWYDVMHAQLQTLPHNVLPDGRIVYASGNVSGQDANNKTANIAPAFTLPAWASAPPAHESAKRFWSPSNLIAHEDTNSGAAYSAHDPRLYGVLLHQALEWVTQDTTPDLLVKFAEMQSLPAMAAKLCEDVARLFAEPEIATLLAYPCLCEQQVAGDIIRQEKNLAVRGSIDRLIIHSDTVWAVDYKTSPNMLRNIADTPVSYRLQMRAYRDILAQIYPQHQVQVAILWTAAPRLDWLSEALLECDWSTAIEK
jgi:ATP-dependent helicase/nuclease subunit A